MKLISMRRMAIKRLARGQGNILVVWETPRKIVVP
jgi:hypothetical protein